MTIPRLWRLLALVFVGVSCEGLTGADSPEIAGRWLAQEGTTRWEMDLNDSGTGNVSGSYLMSEPELGSLAFTGSVSGQYDFPAVSLDYSLVIESFTISCSIRGTMAASGQNIAATVTCSGFGESGSGAVDFRRTG